MTPIEDAWNLNGPSIVKSNPYEMLKSKQNMLQAVISTPNPDVVAFNNDMAYDEYVINIESFKPLRIDITIKDPELINHFKTLSHDIQQEEATKILLAHYRGNTNKIIEKKTDEMINLTNDNKIIQEELTDQNKIEYFESNKSNQTFLYVILALLMFMLYEKLGLVIQHA